MMRILIFSVLPRPLLDRLGEHLALAGHDVINLAGKRSRGRPSPGVRRIIMNFDEGGRASDPQEAWKQALKNGLFGLKALKNLASSWQPDIILCRSGQGAAFFVRQAFPEAFLISFAAEPHEAGIAIELDARLFLESNLRFAPDARAIAKFPKLLQSAVQLEPVCIDADFFRAEQDGAFSCWKLDAGLGNAIGIILTGLAEDAFRAWQQTILALLAKNRKTTLIALTDKGGASARFIRELEALARGSSKRIFATDYLDKDAWRNLCASAPIIFTAASQKKHALECLASGGAAWAAGASELADVPGIRLVQPQKPLPAQLAAIRLEKPDPEVIAAIRRQYACAAVIPDFAARLLAEYEQTTGQT